MAYRSSDGVDPPVLEDDGLALGLGFLQHVVPALASRAARMMTSTYASCDELAERRELVLQLVLGVIELQVEAELVASSLNEAVLAARQPPSDPVWMNPTVRSL